SVLPTATIVSPSTATAPPEIRPTWRMAAPWRGPGPPAQVTTWDAFSIRRSTSVSAIVALLHHRHLDAALLRKGDRLFIPGVHMAHHAHARVGGQHPFQAAGGGFGPVGHRHLPGVDAVA